MAHSDDRSLLEAALVGYESRRLTITTAIADIQKRLANKDGLPASVAPPKKHWLSAEGRARIAAAQRKRWAAAKRAKLI